MSSKYPILDNKPIDQWKVTELKEELKRRRLLVKGLKDDLIRRLDDALRTERVNEGKDVITGDDLVADQPEGEAQFVGDKPEDDAKSADALPEGHTLNSGEQPVVTEFSGKTDSELEGVEHVKVQANASDSVQFSNKEPKGGVANQVTDSAGVMGDLPDISPAVVFENVAPEVTTGMKDTEVTETLGLNGDPEPQFKNQILKPEFDRSESQVENEGSKPLLDSEDQKPQLEDGGTRSPSKHAMLDSSTPNNQVSEVKPCLGFKVNSDSISTDSMSINEKIEIKDNVVSDNANLELDNIKPEMVEPSTVNRAPVVGESNPMDAEEQEEKMASVEVKDNSSNRTADLSKKDDIIDSGYSEKLNLDRSSGDESMDEDLESKQIDSKYNSDDMGDQTETRDKHAVNSDVLGNTTASHMSTEEKEMHADAQTCPSVPSEKRKFNDQEAVGSTEQLKRQRKWTSESLKVTEPQSSPALTTPKDVLTPTLSRGKFSRSDSTVSNEDTQKERVVPPSEKLPTNSLRIDRFLRPFTLKAVQELLGKTGTVTSFWMDHIKTHCYVSYSSIEEAIETRNAVYNLQWPANGGRLLVAEFVDPLEVKNRLEAPQSPAAPITPAAPHQPSPHQQAPRQQLPPPPALPPPPPLSNPPPARERLTNLPPPPPPLGIQDPPIVTLDDLFRKTRATPRIYYLPLTEDQVAAKLEQAKSTK